MSKEHQMFQAIWRKALKTGKVEIEFKNPQDANRARFALYNSVKTVRKGKAFDEELLQAVNDCIVRIVDEKTLAVEHRMNTDMMKTLAQTLQEAGMVEYLQPEPKTPEQLSQEKFLRTIAEPAPEPVPRSTIADKYRGY